MAIYTNIKTGERIRSTKNPDGTVTKTVLNRPTRDNQITNNMVDSGQLPESQRENVPQTTPPPTVNRETQRLSALSSPVSSPTPISQVSPTPNLNLPQPTATEIRTANNESIAGTVQRTRDTYTTMLNTQKADIDARTTRLEKEQKDILDKGGELLQPFREDLEKTERERLKVNENFEANQKLINELDGLLTQSNELIKVATGRQVSGKILEKSLSKTLADVTGRAGVIEAVLSARNNQITQAYTMIDRSIEAVVADRNDELTYYNTLLDLNSKKLISLDSQKVKLAEEERNLALSDIAEAQKTANYIKELMINPETAQFMADAGVSLTDSVDGVKEKMSLQAKNQEVIDMQNSLVEAGYQISPIPVAGGIEVQAGGKTLYAKVRPGSELDMRIKAQEANIAQSYASAAASRASARAAETGRLLELAAAGDPAAISALGLTMPDGRQPSTDLMAFAADYASTGKLPSSSSLPKGITVGSVAELARSMPKPDGAIVSTNTGVFAGNLGDEQRKGITAMNEIVNDTLPFMVQKWNEAQRTNLGGTGLVGGIASKIIPSKAMTEYEQARDEFLSKLLVARSGAAVTEQEYARYRALVPGAFNNTLGIGANGDVKLKSLDNLMVTNFDNFLNSNQLSVYGYSKIKVPARDVKLELNANNPLLSNPAYGRTTSTMRTAETNFTVGEIIENEYGQQGMVQPDGTITLINL